MRKVWVVLGVLSMVFFAACGDIKIEFGDSGKEEEEVQAENEADSGTNEEEAESEEASDNSSNEENNTTDEDASNENGENENNEQTSSLPSVEGILLQAAEAANGIRGMRIEGENNTITEGTAQITDKYFINGAISINPFVQYMEMEQHLTSGGSTEIYMTEMYLTSDRMYMIQDDERWIMIPINESIGTYSAVVTNSHFTHFANHHHAFELTEDENHYILTVSGSGDSFKEIVYGGLKEILEEEIYESYMPVIKEISGTYQLVIDKNSLLLVAMHIDWEQVVGIGGMESRIQEQSSYYYSDFDMDPIVIPKEIIDNAEDFWGAFGN